jgi:UDP-2-acetamido-2-deoxy-ribo-hexuluronate aminotransferase
MSATITQPIRMVDLQGQYRRIKQEVDEAIAGVIDSAQFIGGPVVKAFQEDLEAYLNTKHVIPCANGTDALQIAFMALGLEPGDEVIVPAFTYVATAEVIGLLRLKPVMVDVEPDTFNIDVAQLEQAITPRTKAIVPVHLFGQCANMDAVMDFAAAHNLYVVEDNAQAIGAQYTDKQGVAKAAGTIGHIGCTSFFPSKNLGCYGDGGAIFTNDDALAAQLRMVANHGQSKQYYHDIIGVNSRLDAVQAAVLKVKLQHLNNYCAARRNAADVYDAGFQDIEALQTPVRSGFSTHVFHQYTLRVKDGRRDELRQFLTDRHVPCMIYYPVPLYKQPAFAGYWSGDSLQVTEELCKEVISLPMHTELDTATQSHIIEQVKAFWV